ncbi:MAG: Ig-like domain-containing protein, partial [Verrucomicrobiales bacterium]|nr:Ig-like domain-containing protein [Verrucomicrobiales bacterium]
SDGTYSYAVDNTNAAVQALGVGQFATDTFTYLADDGNGGSAAASLVVTINGVNDAPPSNPGSGPGIYDDTDSIDEEDITPTTGSVLANDADPDGDSLSVAAVNGDAGNVGNSISGSYGTITINADGTYSYTLNNADAAVQALEPGDTATETFSYLADDGNGGSAAATLTITINGELDNEAPVAVDDSRYSTPVYEDSLLLDGSFDNLLSIDLGLGVLSGGWLTGQGSPDSLVGADVTLDIPGVIDGVADTITSSPQGGVFIGLANSNGGESFYTTINNLTPGETYTVRFLQANVGIGGVTQEGDTARLRVDFGSETQYTNPMAYEGEGNQAWVEQSLTFTATNTSQRLEIFADDPDGDLLSGDEYIAIDALVVTAASADVVGYEFAGIDLLANDYDTEGDDFYLSHIDGTAVSSGDTVTLASGNTVTLNSDGTVTFEDDASPLDAGESETFTYTISDEWGQTSTATATMERPQFATDDGFNTVKGRIEANVLTNDDDTSFGALSVIETTGPGDGSVSMNADGTFTYIADPGFTGIDTFSYTVQAADGSTDVASVSINVDSPGTSTYGNLNIALVVDESGSIDLTEAGEIAVGLEAFVTSMLGSGNKISLIGMDDSSVNGRSDHIIEQEVTALSLLNFTTWIAGYRTGRTGNLSDYWESGLSVAANDLSETPDLVIVITDGARGTKSVAQGFVDDMESQGSHVFTIGVSPGNYFGASTDLDTATTDVLTSNPEEANLLLTDIMSTDYSDGGFAELGVSLGNLGPALEDFFTLTIPPVVIDMDNDGVEFDSVEDGIAFDVDGDGESEQVAWADEDDAVLVYDHDQDGDVTSRSEIAFADYKEGADTDLEGLQHFDSDGDGTLDADDEEFSKFALWQDSNGDGRVDEGEMISLLEAGIHSIELQSDQNSYSSADGDVTVHGEATVHYNDGSTGIAADAEFDFSEILADDTEDEDSFEVHTEDGETINLDENAAHAHTCPESAEYCDMPAPPVATVDDQEFTQ